MFKRLTTANYTRNIIFCTSFNRLLTNNYYSLIKCNFSQLPDHTDINMIDARNNSILSNFFNSVKLYPYRFALIYNGQSISYRDLYYRVLQCATYLHSKYDISSCDVIACVTSNRPEFFQLILACHILNCTFLPLNCMVNPDINTEIIQNTNTKLIIHEATLPSNLLHNIDNKNINLQQLFTDFDDEYSWIGSDDIDNINLLEEICSNIISSNTKYSMSNVCQFMSTSGTTGKPKLITHSFDNKCIASNQYLPLFKYYNNEDIFNPISYPSGCRILLTGSTFHVTTYNILTCSVSNGHCAVIPNKKQKNDIKELWKLIELYRVNASCFLSSSIYSLMKYGQSMDGNHLKSIFITGEIIPCELIRKFMKLMANGVNNKSKTDLMRMINFYGSTESEVVGYSNPISINCHNDNDLFDKIMTIRKIPGIELKINEENELMVSSPSLLKEYHNNKEKTDEALSIDNDNKRWYLLGEQITFTDNNDQEFIINARNKDIFITDGSVCYPQSVENVLLRHDLVDGAVVIGIGYHNIYTDQDLPGLDEPIAFITIDRNNENYKNDDILITDLLDLCETYLQKEMGEIPYKIFIVDDIPKTPNGKVLRDELKNIAIDYFKNQQLQYKIA